LEAVSSTQVHQVHSPGPILKKVVTDDTEKIQKAWAAGEAQLLMKMRMGLLPL